MFDPNTLFDDLRAKLALKNDAALAAALEVSPPVVSRVRHGKLPIGPTLILRLHELTDVPVKELCQMVGYAPKTHAY